MCFSSSASRWEVCSLTWTHTHARTCQRPRAGPQEAVTTGNRQAAVWLPRGKGWDTIHGLSATGQPRTGRDESLAVKHLPRLQHSRAQTCAQPQQGRRGELFNLLSGWMPGAPSRKPGLTGCRQTALGPPRSRPATRPLQKPPCTGAWGSAFRTGPRLPRATQPAGGSHEGKAGLTRPLRLSQDMQSTREK